MNLGIVGAGWAGLAAAVAAVDAGHQVTVFEAARMPGGRARAVPATMADGRVVLLDNGQHILIGAYTDSLSLMRQVGVDVDAALLPAADRRAQKPGLMMASSYRTLLREIEGDNFQVLDQRVSLTPVRKLWLAWRVQALGRL